MPVQRSVLRLVPVPAMVMVMVMEMVRVLVKEMVMVRVLVTGMEARVSCVPRQSAMTCVAT